MRDPAGAVVELGVGPGLVALSERDVVGADPGVGDAVPASWLPVLTCPSSCRVATEGRDGMGDDAKIPLGDIGSKLLFEDDDDPHLGAAPRTG